MTAVLAPAVPGPQGPQGPAGPAGPSGGQYLHTQAVAASTWGPIDHDLGYRPNVAVIDSAGTVVIGRVEHHSANSLSIEFSVPFSGTASLT